MYYNHINRLLTVSFLWLSLFISDASPDHMNLDENFPLRVEDAYPLAYRDREVQVYFQYVQQLEQRYRMDLTPILEVGFPLNMQLEIEVPLIFGNTDKTGSADIRALLLYNFNMEGVLFPALTFEAAIDIPTGKNSEGVDPSFKFILSKTLDDGKLCRIHLNGEYGLNVGKQDTEHQHLYALVAGYSQRITPNSILIFDFYREREREKNVVVNFLETGTRTQLNPLTVISIGGGIGIGQESPRFQVTVGLQRSLSGQFFFF
ncbi:MAG: hypothetical protein JW915_18205 [Chitinispirillaceae bacterium]|nr:hypothetical protein [Chitinispirillaceae bacterium]